MCRSMVDIQSPTAEIRRGKKKKIERKYRMKILWSALLHRATIKSRPVREDGINCECTLQHTVTKDIDVKFLKIYTVLVICCKTMI